MTLSEYVQSGMADWLKRADEIRCAIPIPDYKRAEAVSRLMSSINTASRIESLDSGATRVEALAHLAQAFVYSAKARQSTIVTGRRNLLVAICAESAERFERSTRDSTGYR